MIQLRIKSGTVLEARDEARKRGLVLYEVVLHEWSTGHFEVVAFVEATLDAEAKLQRWFLEKPDRVEPARAGTLLFYQVPRHEHF